MFGHPSDLQRYECPLTCRVNWKRNGFFSHQFVEPWEGMDIDLHACDLQPWVREWDEVGGTFCSLDAGDPRDGYGIAFGECGGVESVKGLRGGEH